MEMNKDIMVYDDEKILQYIGLLDTEDGVEFLFQTGYFRRGKLVRGGQVHPLLTRYVDQESWGLWVGVDSIDREMLQTIPEHHYIKALLHNNKAAVYMRKRGIYAKKEI